ncbi:exosporium glycoprotein BclB-related protein [Paenibacillus harenae]|uniref:exosporium glycoprotein BclB-related protein n=1 Tax=Paenibacillus harenae TaxID=306543 RepID=UPI0035932EA2
MGPPGPAGAVGPTGPTGPPGPTGSAGTAGGDTIIPFASGTSVSSNNAPDGSPSSVGLVGFGTSRSDVPVTGGSIDLTGNNLGFLLNLAFAVPRDGTITSISVTFSNTIPHDFGATILTLRAEMWSAPATSNVFTPTGAGVDLSPPQTGTVSLGDISTGSAVLAVPITLGTRLVLVISHRITGGPMLEVDMAGYVSASIRIN